MPNELDKLSGRLRQLLWLLLAGGAFGFIEAAVVVYLRELAYPEGFTFPLREISTLLLRTELLRELATLTLLLALARATRRRALPRFAVFALSFGVWDLAYYLFLKLLLGWPAGLLDWDILFLIPAPWVSPVLAPVLVSLALIACALPILLAPGDRSWRIGPARWVLMTLGGLLILASFLWNSAAVQAGGLPGAYPWWLFSLGMILGLGAAIPALARTTP
jgi:hypothetical protein